MSVVCHQANTELLFQFLNSLGADGSQMNGDVTVAMQGMVGRSNVRTTMIFTLTVKSTTKKEAKNPL